MSGHDDARHEAGHRAHEQHEVHPHESPWQMWVPLVVLSGLAIVGGGLNLPFTGKTKLLERWLEPVVELGEVHIDVGTSTKIALALIATIVGLAGIALAYAVYVQKRVEPVEPEILLRAWRVDETIAAAVDGPGRAAAAFAADVIDKKGIDGAVNGAGVLVREGGNRLRVVQSGYLRSYALGIAGGAVLLLAWFVSRAAL